MRLLVFTRSGPGVIEWVGEPPERISIPIPVENTSIRGKPLDAELWETNLRTRIFHRVDYAVPEEDSETGRMTDWRFWDGVRVVKKRPDRVWDISKPFDDTYIVVPVYVEGGFFDRRQYE